ncbi:Clavaminate synthase-like protein [Obba rivulosa]|uniref:Clavaminate synthase-like protein n=1 Tax=Obba rivulosa TaxID=1052685 RepID=A0A8E2AI78_9APHY|nr:Clavaminate synthase-like protein [Obba rivulosa]
MRFLRSGLHFHKSGKQTPGFRLLSAQSASTIPTQPLFHGRTDGSHSLRTYLTYKNERFSHRWLRDCCQCPACVHPSTLQKLHRTTDIPGDIALASEDSVCQTSTGVSIKWKDGHHSEYSTSFLDTYSKTDRSAVFQPRPQVRLWDRQAIEQTPDLFVDFRSLLHSSTRYSQAIEQLAHYGLLFVTDVPNEKTSDMDCELRKLAEYIGQLRRTFYGETWDVKNMPNSRNIAYTNVHLGLHMDLLYFEHPPRWQILHCLRNRVHGGKSIFVDSLKAAETLRIQYPSHFEALAWIPVSFHYNNDGHHLRYSHPTIELWPYPADDAPPIRYVNYSPPFQAPLPPDTPDEFYAALKTFVALLESPSMRYEYTLPERTAVVFDNRRVLHARTAFTDLDPAGDAQSSTQEPNRWLKGCYLEADSILDNWRTRTGKMTP